MSEDRNSLTREERRIRKQASLWLAERDAGWEPGRETAFEIWKNADIRHEIALGELEKSWSRLTRLQQVMDDPLLRPDPDILGVGSRITRKRRQRIYFVLGSVAATLAIHSGVFWFATQSSIPGSADPVSYATQFNDFKQIVMEDGSILELNANTRVTLDFDDHRRQVYLNRGEAHFQVAKDPSRPFLVEAGSVTVRAVGTAFNVRYQTDEIQVFVTEGRVSVDPVPDHTDTADETDGFSELPDLFAGEQATISVQGSYLVPLVSKVDTEEVEEILAWKGPRLFFKDTPLLEAVRQFNEHNELQVVIKGESLEQLSIGGSFLVEDVAAFVRLLTGEGSVIAENPSPDLIVLKPSDRAGR
ncbi:MAG: FecR domain-containing protein [Verrucomicrobiae bacterium]|nr:FecR domain-containing protein [Verrucomicrobiae bacterium]